ncbi:MAG: cytochrome b/b6 domain-containing protein [Burkholderiales bacterium]|nr:cytochrome b/b6 domain-containing protein [Burkholderiales bacterium]
MIQKIRVWDLPTRLFHWALVACVMGLVITGNIGGEAMAWHFPLGYAVLTLILFRLVWGFIGGYWSRFRNFVVSPGTLVAYLRGARKPEHAVGHNPLGSLSVLALLLIPLAQVTAGLMSDDEIATAGPLVSKVPGAWVSLATFMHTEVIKIVLIVLVLLHVGAVLWYRFRKNQNLVRPMLLGDKELDGEFQSSRDTAGTRLIALVILALCALAVAALLRWAA